MADNVYISTTNSNRYLDFFQVNFTVLNANAQGIWETAYNTIMDANNVINSSLTGTARSNQYRGEALTLRALMHFELVKHFAKPYTVEPNGLGVPIVLSYDPFAKPQRNTTGMLWQHNPFIIFMHLRMYGVALFLHPVLPGVMCA